MTPDEIADPGPAEESSSEPRSGLAGVTATPGEVVRPPAVGAEPDFIPPPPPPPPPPGGPGKLRRKADDADVDHSVRGAGSPRVSPLWWIVTPVSLVLLAAVIYLLARPVPYVVFAPGSANPVEPLITVKGKEGQAPPKLQSPDEDILFVTVSIQYPNGAYLLFNLNDDYHEVAPETQYLGDQSQEQNRTYNLALMTDSKDKAVSVALQALGYPVKVTGVGAVLTDVDPNRPVAKVVRPGDTVIEANGKPVTSAQDLVDVIAATTPGDTVKLKLQRLEQSGTLTVDAPTVENPEKPGRALLGVSLETRPHYEFPFTVDIDSGAVGGPSAGLSFTLAIIDRLSPGSLTGGNKVAITGTIELDGSVGEVGGVRQKVKAAINAGATLFLVPAGEYDEAVDAAKGKLEVGKVETISDALAALEDHGGTPVERVGEGAGGN